MNYTNSSLVDYTEISPNRNINRKNPITRITPHCVVGQCSVEALGNLFVNPSRQGSSNYGIGVDGRIGMYVEEKDRSWCSSSGENDHRAITIECASETKEPYKMNDVVYSRLIELCVDICKRYNKTKLIWFADKEKTLNYTPKTNEMVLTVHRWFANKSCPGEWLYSRLGELADTVTSKLEVGNMENTYTVKKGDSLWSIAVSQLGDGKRYTEIKKLNGLTSDFIHGGMVLKIPASKPSETVSESRYEKIGKAFEKALKDINNLESVKKLLDLTEG